MFGKYETDPTFEHWYLDFLPFTGRSLVIQRRRQGLGGEQACRLFRD